MVAALHSPWFALVADLHDVILPTTVTYASSRGLKSLQLPLTTRTITCPTALGSDSEPVPVKVNGVPTYLADSMQFALEYGCRMARSGCYTIMPSFRAEEPDSTHLGQFTHSEAEIVGDLDDLIRYVDGYVRTLAATVLDRLGDRLAQARGDISHLERMVGRREAFEQLTFEEAVRVVNDEDGAVLDNGVWRSFTRKGELLLMERVSEFVWVRHFDSLAVPFYQAFVDPSGKIANNADLYFGMGEVAGAGERHADAEGLRKSMALHGVNESEYAWYVRMREVAPLRTSGFGLGVERFLMWVLNHGDIRDVSLISRVDESKAWPAAVVRP
uniref:amino acid--tRNA ligase-related protein n=1 Tax=Nonomuraea bangladeshensis TaxID=404385 RepID=UPI003F495E47